MVSFTGWTNIVFISIMASIYPVKRIYMKLAKERGKKNIQGLKNLYNFSRKAHPILGVTILMIGLYHGSNAFSLTVLHTGTVLLYSILTMGVIAILGSRIKATKKYWRLIHRSIAPLVILFAVLHVFWKNLF